MCDQKGIPGLAYFIKLLATCLLLVGLSESVSAQNSPTEAQILEALRSKVKTRGIQAPTNPTAAGERTLIDNLRTRSTRSLTIEEREKVAEIVRSKPNINLEITFDYNSASIGPQSVPTLIALGRALSNDDLQGVVFLINGHTDAKGGLKYNQDLSERRAEAVKSLLVKQFNLLPTALIAIGFGKTQLKNAADPYAGENRRVQIVNTETR